MDNVSKYVTACYTRGYTAITEKIGAFSNNDKASMSGSAISILVLLVTLLLCALLFGTLQGQTTPKITALNDANATASYNSITASGWSAIDLFSMIPYVAVFVVLLGMLLGLSRAD